MLKEQVCWNGNFVQSRTLTQSKFLINSETTLDVYSWSPSTTFLTFNNHFQINFQWRRIGKLITCYANVNNFSNPHIQYPLSSVSFKIHVNANIIGGISRPIVCHYPSLISVTAQFCYARKKQIELQAVAKTCEGFISMQLLLSYQEIEFSIQIHITLPWCIYFLNMMTTVKWVHINTLL